MSTKLPLPPAPPSPTTSIPLFTPPTSRPPSSEEAAKLTPSATGSDVERQASPARAVNARGGLEGEDDVPMNWRTILPIWFLSFCAGVLLVMYNKYILSTLDFGYPVFLTTCHMGFAVIGTRAVRLVAPGVVGHGPENRLSWPTYSRSIVPIGILFSASLILSNSAVLLLSVSLVQMLKAFVPAAILLVSAALGLRRLERTSLGVIVVISLGCALAALGEVRFSMPGFICQALAVLCEASRVVLIQLLLQGQKMDPLTSLSHYAPVCFMLNIILVPIIEGPAPFLALLPSSSPLALPSSITLAHLVANAALAFSLNVLALVLIQRLGSLVMSLAGVGKDILIIAGAAVVFGTVVTPMQLCGYGISVVGLVLYRYTVA